MKVVDRILFAFTALWLVFSTAVLLFCAFSTYPADVFYPYVAAFVTEVGGRPEAAAVGIVVILIAFRFFWLAVYRKKKSRTMLIQETVLGGVQVSFTAIEHLVSRLLKRFTTVRDMKCSFAVKKEGLVITLKMVIMPDCNIPEITADIQQVLRDGVREVLGIEIAEVKILIEKMQVDKKRVE